MSWGEDWRQSQDTKLLRVQDSISFHSRVMKPVSPTIKTGNIRLLTLSELVKLSQQKVAYALVQQLYVMRNDHACLSARAIVGSIVGAAENCSFLPGPN